ncbi:MAG: histidinol dehydrogenase [Gammaproteobacteria bacterium]|nr:histidinol dehydrogenase [Gammaproteobacteria bacterium]TVQ48809.1 MAG: histidinol dehydrogenase [Gammaproteobacteria bacterium]
MKITHWNRLSERERDALLERPANRISGELRRQVDEIIAQVRQDGDAALREFTARFDRVELDGLRVGAAELEAAESQLPNDALAAIDRAIDNVRTFHAAQRPAEIDLETSPGVRCQRVNRPLAAVGLYVPAGSAPLPSTAIMLAVPAALAGCPTRVICTPPNRDGRADPAVLAVARRCGVEQVFKVGGAQAVAAMAFGTATIPKVDKIFGPGNAWVTAAKTAVAEDPRGAALDMPAGPSEVLVIADDTADPVFVASDLLSQAEHGPDSQVILLTTRESIAERVADEVARQLERLGRRETAGKALANSALIVVGSVAEAIEVSNRYAPEHLIVQVDQPRRWLDAISHAGSVFLGPWTPESIGDYCSGTNHVLPTYGFARSYSGLSLTAFLRQMTVQELTPAGLADLGPVGRRLAELEGLDAHGEAISLRLAALRRRTVA